MKMVFLQLRIGMLLHGKILIFVTTDIIYCFKNVYRI